MTNPTQRQLPDFQKYQYAAVARLMSQSKENKGYAVSALEMLAGSNGLNLGEDADGFIAGAKASEKGIETAINIYAGKFQEKRGEYKPAELISWYNPVLSSADPEDAEKIKAELAKYDETYADIESKYTEAVHLVEGLKKGIEYTDEQKSNAEKTIQKYNDVMILMQELDNYALEELRPEVVKTERKSKLKGLASKL